MKLPEARRLARKAAKFWIGNLGLGYWDVQVEYHDGLFEHSPMTAAFCEANWKYLRAVVTLGSTRMCELETEHDIERLVLHELCHALVNEMRAPDDESLDHEERVCSMLTNAFMWTKNAGDKK